jgi:hypothetical protein
MRNARQWFTGLAAALTVLLVLLAGLAAFMDFADVPCQDGTWSEAKYTCVPDSGPAN